MEKVYGTIDVYEALQQRLEYIFAEFDNIYVAFSGGKDSGLLLHLVMRYMHEHGINRRIGLMHQDFEAQYEETSKYVEYMFNMYADDMEAYWICLPMGSKTALSNYELYWYPWDDEKRDIWVRPMPQNKWVINLENCPFDFYKPKMLQEDLYRQFNRWYRDAHGGGKTIALIGMRCDESLHRYNAVINKRHAYNGKSWISWMYKDTYVASPLYDWTVEDIWTAYGKFDLAYNHIYDLFYKAGVPLSKMRVASPFNEWATQSLNLYRVLEPATWARLVGRVQGANFANIYGTTKALGYREITLPPGHTWQSYTMFLLDTLPEEVRQNYIEKFKFSINFWHKTGGGFSDEVIQDIRSHGYHIRENGVSNYTKGGKTKIVFEGDIPDNTDDVKSTIDIPSWKRMCFCILKNDHLCRFMGFGPNKRQQAQINAIKAKYNIIVHGGRY